MTAGAVVWFTGLPSSGKSSLAEAVHAALRERRIPACLLDGDAVRSALVPPPDHDTEGRDAFYASLANLAVLLCEQGLVVLVAATAHRREHRARARRSASRFIEVYLSADPAECARRDAKGLYRAAARGEITGLPGAGASYEPPESPDVVAPHGAEPAAVAAVLGAVEATLNPPR